MTHDIENILKKIQEIKVNLTEDQILERLADRQRWPVNYHTGHFPSLERIDETGRKFQDFYLSDGWPDIDRMLYLYNEGYTFILSGTQFFSKDVLTITKILSASFNTYVTANIYLGKGLKSISFDKHRHDYHVMVKNVIGSSGWIIDKKYTKLSGQDAIFIPAETDHQVIEIFDTKATITYNIRV